MAKIANRPTGVESRYEGDQELETFFVCGVCDEAVNESGNVAFYWAEPKDASVEFAVFHKKCDARADRALYPRSIALEKVVAQLARRHLSRTELLALANQALTP